jgi:hypothetical protein
MGGGDNNELAGIGGQFAKTQLEAGERDGELVLEG